MNSKRQNKIDNISFIDNFDRFVEFLKLSKFTVKMHDYDGYHLRKGASFNDDNIFGVIIEESDNPEYGEGIAFDHKKLFDKWGKCPFVLSIPKDTEEMSFVLNAFKYLSSKEGFKRSNNFDICVRNYSDTY